MKRKHLDVYIAGLLAEDGSDRAWREKMTDAVWEFLHGRITIEELARDFPQCEWIAREALEAFDGVSRMFAVEFMDITGCTSRENLWAGRRRDALDFVEKERGAVKATTIRP